MTTDTNLPPHLQNIGRQLVAAARNQSATQVRRRVPRSRMLVGLVPVAAAAALTVVVVNSGTASAPSQRHLVASAPGHSSNRSSAPAGQRTKLRRLAHPTAKQVLSRAAYVALQTTTVTPEPDQFIYTETSDGNGQITQNWLSVDGTRASIIQEPGQSTPTMIAGCATGHITARSPGEDGKPLQDFIPKSLRGKPYASGQQLEKDFPGGKIPMDGPLITTKCTPQPAFYPDMPTDPSAMQAFLLKIGDIYPASVAETPAAALNNLAKNVGFMLDSDYLLPAQEAALYRFLASTQWVTVVPDTEDVSGRPGIGVEWDYIGSKAMLVFDPSTYEYLGWSTIGEQGQTGGSALLQTAIVNGAGQQPGVSQAQTTTTGQQTTTTAQQTTTSSTGVSG
jgi:hypothetical protein